MALRFLLSLLFPILLNGSGYLFGEQRTTWYAARQWCQDMAMDLISLHSEETFESLKQSLNGSDLSQHSHWIGLVHDHGDPTNISSYHWSDQSAFDYGFNLSGGVHPWKEVRGVNPNSLLKPSCVRLQNNADPKWAWDDVDCNSTINGLLAVPICHFPINYSYPDPVINSSVPILFQSPSASNWEYHHKVDISKMDSRLLIGLSLMLIGPFACCCCSIYHRLLRSKKSNESQSQECESISSSSSSSSSSDRSRHSEQHNERENDCESNHSENGTTDELVPIYVGNSETNIFATAEGQHTYILQDGVSVITNEKSGEDSQENSDNDVEQDDEVEEDDDAKEEECSLNPK